MGTWTVGKVGWRRRRCPTYLGRITADFSCQLSPDGTRLYAGLSTEYGIYDFPGTDPDGGFAADIIDNVDLDDLYGDDWQFDGRSWAQAMRPNDGLMYAYDQVLELDGAGGTLPEAQHHGALMRFDPDDGSSFVMLYLWPEDSEGAAIVDGRVCWHPEAPGTIWIAVEQEGVVTLFAWDIAGESMSTVDVIAIGDAQLDLGIWQYDQGFAVLIRKNSGTESLVYVYDIPTATSDTIVTTIADQYPAGVDYFQRRLLYGFDDTSFRVNGVAQITAAGSVSIGSIESYDDCALFEYDTGFGPVQTSMSDWFAPADRSRAYMSDGNGPTWAWES